jgi:hypothetical protein
MHLLQKTPIKDEEKKRRLPLSKVANGIERSLRLSAQGPLEE